MKMMHCENCGEEMHCQSEEALLAEEIENFGRHIKPEYRVCVCDTCYQKVLDHKKLIGFLYDTLFREDIEREFE